MKKSPARVNEKPSEKPAVSETPAPLPAAAPLLGVVDVLVAAGLLAVTLGVCLPWAVRYRREATALDQQRVALVERCSSLQASLKYLEARRTSETQLRHAVSKFVANVEAKNAVPWPTVVSELSVRRPRGVWTTSLTGSGSQFRAEISATDPRLVTQYSEGLRNSPYVEFAGTPAGDPFATQWSVIGRVRGE